MANGSTVITYGNVTLKQCLTLEFRQEPIYDDLSDTDLMHHRFVVRVIGYVHGFDGWCNRQLPFNPLGQTSNFNSASVQFIGMRVNLPPRQPIAMRIGATSVGQIDTALTSSGGYLALYAEPYPASVPNTTALTHLDVRNGPRCNHFVIKRVVADNVFQVEAEFEVCKVECVVAEATASGRSSDGPLVAGSVPNNSKGILSHRWGVTDDIDANLKTVRTYRGRLRTASANISPNNFRYYVVPPLAQGMRRDAIQFAVSPDGLNLDYTITDRETIVAAPYPAKKWNIQHTETVDSGHQVHSALDITLSGDRTCAKADLITIGMNVIWAKLIVDGNNLAGKVMLESISVTDHIGDDQTVTLSARGRRTPRELKEGDLVIDDWEPWFLGAQVIGQVLTKDQVYRNPVPNQDNNWEGIQSFGGLETPHAGSTPFYQGPLSLIGALLPYLQTPCNDTHRIVPSSMTALPTDENSSPSAAPQATVTALVDKGWTDDDLPLLSVGGAANMYTLWKMESVYKDSAMKAPLPIANTSYSSGSASTRIVTLSQPQTRRIVRAEAERIGAEPQMPSPSQIEALVGNTPGLVQTYLGMRRRFATPFYTAAGQKVYFVAVEFQFALSRKPADSDTLAIGRTMWTTDGDQYTSSVVTQGWTP